MAELLDIPLANIQRDPQQPRQDFNEEGLRELADSIKARGVIQAISVRKTQDGTEGPEYMIIAGERRWRASKLAGTGTIPAILKEGDEAGSETIRAQQLTENLFREDLNPVEKAEFIQARVNELKMAGIDSPSIQVAKELGVDTSWVTKNTAILKVSEDIRALARLGKIRGYYMIKKIDKLSGVRREDAISQINNDTFKGTVFFKRKRFSEEEFKGAEGEGGDNPQEKRAPAKRRLKSLSFTVPEIIALIERTDYVFVLERNDTGWRKNDERLPAYLDNFKKWAITPDERTAVKREVEEI